MLIALGGGLWSAGGAKALQGQWLPLALVLAGWLPLWEAMTTPEWFSAFLAWRRWSGEATMPRLPYLREGTPGAQLWHALAAARRWWREEGAAIISKPLRQSFLAFAVSLAISAAIGTEALLLTLLFAALAELAALWYDGGGVEGELWLALGNAAMPWLLGAVVGGSLPGQALLSALAAATMSAAFLTPHLAAMSGFLLSTGWLLYKEAPIAAALLLLVTYPPLRFAAVPLPKAEHRRLVLPWLWIALLILAGA